MENLSPRPATRSAISTQTSLLSPEWFSRSQLRRLARAQQGTWISGAGLWRRSPRPRRSELTRRPEPRQKLRYHLRIEARTSPRSRTRIWRAQIPRRRLRQLDVSSRRTEIRAPGRATRAPRRDAHFANEDRQRKLDASSPTARRRSRSTRAARTPCLDATVACRIGQ